MVKARKTTKKKAVKPSKVVVVPEPKQKAPNPTPAKDMEWSPDEPKIGRMVRVEKALSDKLALYITKQQTKGNHVSFQSLAAAAIMRYINDIKRGNALEGSRARELSTEECQARKPCMVRIPKAASDWIAMYITQQKIAGFSCSFQGVFDEAFERYPLI